jgi:hypothetical protein
MMLASASKSIFCALLVALLVLLPQAALKAKKIEGRRVGFINDTPNFQLDLTIDGNRTLTLYPGKIERLTLEDDSPTGEHELVVKAFVQSKHLGRRQIGKTYTKTFSLTIEERWSPAGSVGWCCVFTYRDFLPQLASMTPERRKRVGANGFGASHKWYHHQGAVEKWKKADIEELVCEVSERYSVPACLLTAVISVESAFNSRAVSCKGALGLMQLMPETCKRFQVRRPLHPRDNIEGGAKYLSYLLNEWSLKYPTSQRLEFSLAAYHAGEGRVEQYGGVPPYRETEKYVREVLERSRAL